MSAPQPNRARRGSSFQNLGQDSYNLWLRDFAGWGRRGIILTVSWFFVHSCMCSPLANPNQKQGYLWSSSYRSASGVEQIGREMGLVIKGANEIQTAQAEKYLLELITGGHWGLRWKSFQGSSGIMYIVENKLVIFQEWRGEDTVWGVTRN